MTELDQFNNVKIKKRTHCVVCEKKCGTSLIKLPKFPLTEIYVDKKIEPTVGFVDQEFHFCSRCGHGQLINIIDPYILYGSSYKTRTSTSQSAIKAVDIFLEFVNKVIGNRKIETILEIGCNDLYILQKLKDKSNILYGIDPMLKNKYNTFDDDKIKIIGDFIENVDLKTLGAFDIILSSHTIEHIENPKTMFENLITNSNESTIFIFQFPGLESLINDARFDQVFHQHLNYFSLQSIFYLINRVGGEVIDFNINTYHWGAILIAFKKKGDTKLNNVTIHDKQKITKKLIKTQYTIFKECMNITSIRLKVLKNETIYGYGAALMLPILGYYINGLLNIKYILDDDVNKKGYYYLNFPVQITLPAEVNNFKNSIVIVTAINSTDSARAIVRKLIDLNIKEIILPTNIL